MISHYGWPVIRMIGRSNRYIARPGNFSASGTIQGLLPARTLPGKPLRQVNDDPDQAPDGGELRAVAVRPGGTDTLPRGGLDLMGQGITGCGSPLVGGGRDQDGQVRAGEVGVRGAGLARQVAARAGTAHLTHALQR